MWRIALAQIAVGPDKRANLARARDLLERARTQGAGLVLFPETFMSEFGPRTPPEVLAEDAEPLDGPFVAGMQEAARRTGRWVVFGMRERSPRPDRCYNTTVVLDENGTVRAAYRKTHLYDAFGQRESAAVLPGDRLPDPVPSPFGRLGVFVCYELRFPEVARELVLRGADILLVPAYWVRGALKEEQWTDLVKVRALENTVWVAACDQVGNHAVGRSLVADPAGLVVAQGPETETLLLVDVDPGRAEAVRERFPSLAHRRPALYGTLTAQSTPAL
ncbi:MAG: carbon-nitrogen hydrolase family protein [Actinomycetia bacterium]|nr:carbon-nitrogen hydrolase family protein [Actinomycetes bacterium]